MKLRSLLLLIWGLQAWLGPAARAQAAGGSGGWEAHPALSTLTLRTLAAAPGGLLWAGTDDGVYRYDGTHLVAVNALQRSSGRGRGPAGRPTACVPWCACPMTACW